MTDEVLHVLVRLLLRWASPEVAHRAARRIGSLLPQHGSREEVRLAADRIGRRGTCLSRVLTLAARAEGAEVVIGVEPTPGRALFAHAWLEIEGEPLDGNDVAGREIARMRHRDARHRQV